MGVMGVLLFFLVLASVVASGFAFLFLTLPSVVARVENDVLASALASVVEDFMALAPVVAHVEDDELSLMTTSRSTSLTMGSPIASDFTDVRSEYVEVSLSEAMFLAR